MRIPLLGIRRREEKSFGGLTPKLLFFSNSMYYNAKET